MYTRHGMRTPCPKRTHDQGHIWRRTADGKDEKHVELMKYLTKNAPEVRFSALVEKYLRIVKSKGSCEERLKESSTSRTLKMDSRKEILDQKNKNDGKKHEVPYLVVDEWSDLDEMF